MRIQHTKYCKYGYRYLVQERFRHLALKYKSDYKSKEICRNKPQGTSKEDIYRIDNTVIGICCGKCNAGKLCLVSELSYEEGCKYGNKGCFSCTLHLLFLLVTVITLKRTVGKPEESNCRNTLDNPHVKIIGKSRSDSYCKEIKHSRCCPGAYKYISDLIFAGHGYKQKLRLVTHLRNKYRCKYQREYAHENVPLIFFCSS